MVLAKTGLGAWDGLADGFPLGCLLGILLGLLLGGLLGFLLGFLLGALDLPLPLWAGGLVFLVFLSTRSVSSWVLTLETSIRPDSS